MRTAWLGLIVAGSLAMPAQASAAASVAIGVSADPTEEVTYQLTVSGGSDVSSQLFLKVKPPGSQPCGATLRADQGSSSFNRSFAVGRSFSRAFDIKPPDSGEYIACAWVQRASVSTSADAASSRSVAVRVPRASVTVQAPVAVDLGSRVPFRIITSLEVRRQLFMVVNPPGVPCAANYIAGRAQRRVLNGLTVVAGTTTRTASHTAGREHGMHLICGWVQEDYRDTVPEATFGGQYKVNGAACVSARTAAAKHLRDAATAKKLYRQYRRQAARRRGQARRTLLAKAARERRKRKRALAAAATAQQAVTRECT